MINIIEEKYNGKLIGKNASKKLLFELDLPQPFCVTFMHLILRGVIHCIKRGKEKEKSFKTKVISRRNSEGKASE